MKIKDKSKIYHVVARLPPEKKAELEKIAKEQWGLSGGNVLRKMIKRVLQKQISLLELLRHNIKNIDEKAKSKHYTFVSTRLSEKENADFCAICANWDFTPGTLARFLIQYFFTMDDKDSLWSS
jgi:ABC-type sugar transport system ATPase subunit